MKNDLARRDEPSIPVLWRQLCIAQPKLVKSLKLIAAINLPATIACIILLGLTGAAWSWWVAAGLTGFILAIAEVIAAFSRAKARSGIKQLQP